ncbi:MAG: M48 family metallopeptidase [Bacteroidota bacterium]
MYCGKTLPFLLLLIPACTECLAQLQAVHSFRKDDTALKRKYWNQALIKKEALINALAKENSKDYKRAYDNMFETVEDLLMSHRSVTEQTADSYIKSVASKIIDANPELRELEVRMVFSRDFFPNAYSFGEGTIAFNAGLFVYLNSEAELAFILCHELAHFYLDHSRRKLDRYVDMVNSDSLKKEIKRITKKEYRVAEQADKLVKALVFDVSRHSRYAEEEADRVGMRFLKNSGYSGNGFITTMQLLDKVDDTTIFAPLNLQKVLSFPDYPFRERWIKKESVIFGAMNPDDASVLTKKEKDSLKTHPDCLKRIALLKDSALKITGRDFQADEKMFRQLKQDFVPEIVEDVYKNRNISFNLYLSLQMLQEGRHVPLAVYSIARDMNELYKHQKEHQLGLIIETENRRFTEGYNALLRMLYRLRLNEIADLNAAFCSFYSEQMKGYEGFAEEMKRAAENKKSHQ